MTPVRRLSLGYVLALSAIAALILSGQVFIQRHLDRQARDASLVNIAGRQRMLSQRLCALTFAIDRASGAERSRHLAELAGAADLWEQTARTLRGSPELLPTVAVALFSEIEPYQTAMLATVRRIQGAPDEAGQLSRELFEQGDAFLLGMDRIVAAYDRDAVERVEQLKRLELLLFAASLAVLLLEGLFVFRPLVNGVRRQLVALVAARSAIEASFAEKRVLERQLIEAADRERRTLGEDLHDGVCQELIGTTFLLSSIEASVGDAARARLAEAIAALEGVVEQMRRLAKGLHPVGVEHHGLGVALREVAATALRTFGVACDVVCSEGIDAVPSDVAMHAFRIAQEAVVNAARHAKATRIDVRAGVRDQKLSVLVEDDGVGIDEAGAPGMGLRTMRSRAELAGATLAVERLSEGGTRVRCEFPLAGKAVT